MNRNDVRAGKNSSLFTLITHHSMTEIMMNSPLRVRILKSLFSVQTRYLDHWLFNLRHRQTPSPKRVQPPFSAVHHLDLEPLRSSEKESEVRSIPANFGSCWDTCWGGSHGVSRRSSFFQPVHHKNIIHRSPRSPAPWLFLSLPLSIIAPFCQTVARSNEIE